MFSLNILKCVLVLNKYLLNKCPYLQVIFILKVWPGSGSGPCGIASGTEGQSVGPVRGTLRSPGLA